MSSPTEPPDHSELVRDMNHYIKYFETHNIHSGNIQHHSNEIKKCKSLIQLAELRCKPTKKQQRLAPWQKELRSLMLELQNALPEELTAKIDLSPDNTNNTDNTGNPYVVQFLNT